MSQQRDLIRYNPYKASRHTGGRKDPRIVQAWEDMKTLDPDMYRKHEMMKAYYIAQEPLVDAVLDDPILMAELEALMQSGKQKQYASEYALLAIEAGASKREIKNAYRRQARKLHPDKGGDEAAMKAVNAAYKRLLAATKE